MKSDLFLFAKINRAGMENMVAKGQLSVFTEQLFKPESLSHTIPICSLL